MNLQFINNNFKMYMQENLLHGRLKAHSHTFHKIVDFNPVKEKLLHLDFTDNNKELINIDLSDTEKFSAYVEEKLKKSKAKFGIGGYNENRVLYKRSQLFNRELSRMVSKDRPIPSDSITNFKEKSDNNYSQFSAGQSHSFSSPVKEIADARTLHLGIDIWGEVGTKVYAPLGGIVHSYGFNNTFGDYGATLILLHQLDTVTFFTLYGHLSLDDISRLTETQYVIRGQVIGHFGKPEENGYWPPHLHFQLIKDMDAYEGDFPGVCKIDDKQKYLSNCPDPDLIINMMQYAV